MFLNQNILDNILQEMLPVLNNLQLSKLKTSLIKHLQIEGNPVNSNQPDFIAMFIKSKTIEGCSNKTLKFYERTLQIFDASKSKEWLEIEASDIRNFLDDYQKTHDVSNVSLDNLRRILSSFFAWLEAEELILKNPIKRIHKIKSPKILKETFTDEEMEILHNSPKNLRDIALVDILSTTGMRVGELVKLKISDVNLEERECKVSGKGSKDRIVYFDARTKISLKNYLNSRSDFSEFLFVSLRGDHRPLTIGGVEGCLKKLSGSIDSNRVHPHKFRRSFATKAIDKGMPIEQVQQLLGHQKIDTTLLYAMVKQANVKFSHRRYLS